MSRSLAVVADNTAQKTDLTAASGQAESLSSRVQRLQNEAREMATQHVRAFGAAIDDLARLAADIAQGGDAYPVGAREIARQMVAAADGRSQVLDAVLERSALRGPGQARRSAN